MATEESFDGWKTRVVKEEMKIVRRESKDRMS